jgi:antitoxin YefM
LCKWYDRIAFDKGEFMKNVTARKAQESLPRLLEEVTASHKPIQITGDSSNGILIAEEDWQAIQETVYLLSIPGMRESIREGLKTPIEDCSTELTW